MGKEITKNMPKKELNELIYKVTGRIARASGPKKMSRHDAIAYMHGIVESLQKQVEDIENT